MMDSDTSIIDKLRVLPVYVRDMLAEPRSSIGFEVLADKPRFVRTIGNGALTVAEVAVSIVFDWNTDIANQVPRIQSQRSSN